MRGALIRAHGSPPPLGIIPADAGSTLCFTTLRLGVKDHPRGCGEHKVLYDHYVEELGSSPRMRGAQACHVVPDDHGRIIPADAGST